MMSATFMMGYQNITASVGHYQPVLVFHMSVMGLKMSGTYEVKALFSGDKTNYELISDMTSTLSITQATYDLSDITFEDQRHL